MAGFDRVVEETTKYLEGSKSFSREHSRPGPEIVDFMIKIEGINLSRGSLFSYLSLTANDESVSNIVSGGPRSGYWLEKAVEKPERKLETVEIPVGKEKKKFSEKTLYPLVELWLATKGYRSKDASTAKSGGKWGNPDIVGLNRIQSFGVSDIEIATCEVKISLQNWEQFIFESISHKRFSNRSFFCFRYDGTYEVPSSMLYYAEKFRIGLVQILLTDKELAEIGAIEADFGKLENYISNFRETFPALYDSVSSQEKSILLERLGVRDEKTFYGFGKEY